MFSDPNQSVELYTITLSNETVKKLKIVLQYQGNAENLLKE